MTVDRQSSQAQKPGPSRKLLIPVIYLMLFAAISAALIATTARWTRAPIAANEAAQIMKVLDSLLPQDGYDNSPHLDMILVGDPDLLGSDDALPVYRARLNGAPVTAILTVIAPGGYVGSIKLLVGIRPDGTITGVRTLEHLETPGLGDKIDYEKTPWIGSFTGRSIDKPPLAAWETRRSGGEFEQITGATVTSRAVVSGVRNALLYFEENAEFIFTAPARPDPQ